MYTSQGCDAPGRADRENGKSPEHHLQLRKGHAGHLHFGSVVAGRNAGCAAYFFGNLEPVNEEAALLAQLNPARSLLEQAWFRNPHLEV